MLQARRLVEAGVPLVTVFWPNDGITNVSVYWDTHSRNFIDLKTRLMPAADQAFSALLDDLEERGMLDETLIVSGPASSVNRDRFHPATCLNSVFAFGNWAHDRKDVCKTGVHFCRTP